ncbi:MAG: TonB-dependent receptor, partial [Gammaproteobacteria bacterium]|nr:TonB-dependent receptor [Gammaproteobacteria bacterium]
MLALLLVPLSDRADAETGIPAVELSQIRVTAAKSDRDPFTIAESVSVIGREQIEAEQPSRLGDLLLDLPNVDIGGGPRGVGQQVVIRGLGDERILFLLDGARQNFDRAHNARVFIDPDLLKQVEVLRGPASALWGSGALGGVVALT